MSKQNKPRPQIMPNADFGDRQISGSSVVATQNDDYIARRNAIADSADEYRGADLMDLDGEPVRRSAPEEDVEEENVEASGEESAEEQSEQPRRFKIKVNGRELDLTEEELIQRAQKVESADEYLKYASEAVRNAKTAATLPVQDEEPKVEEDDLALVRAIQMGSEDEAVKAIRKLRAKPSEVTPDAVARVVDERLSFQEAAKKFKSDYADLLADPFLKKLVYERDSELAQNQPELGYEDRLKRVGDEIREWKQKVAGGAPAPKLDKAARKASVANVPAAGGRQSMGSSEDGEENPENVIAAMAKARGQGRAVQH